MEEAIIARPPKFNEEQTAAIADLIRKHGALGAKKRYGDISYPTILKIAKDYDIDLCRRRRPERKRRRKELTAKQLTILARLTSPIPMA